LIRLRTVDSAATSRYEIGSSPDHRTIQARSDAKTAICNFLSFIVRFADSVLAKAFTPAMLRVKSPRAISKVSKPVCRLNYIK
jgi:hypothetical protein